MRHHALSAGVPDLICLSWNVHRARGNDGVFDPQRTLDTLMDAAWRPDIDALCLQEADAERPPYGKIFDASDIETRTGLRSVHTDASLRYSAQSTGFLGMIVFLHSDVTVRDVRIIDLPGVYPRGAVIVEGEKDGTPFCLINTHLSLSQPLRMAQMRTIGQHLARYEPRQTVLVGDLNEWRPWLGLAFSQRIAGHRFMGPAKASFPVQLPILPLDRVLASHRARVTSVEVLDSPAIRTTSDHRPILGHVNLTP